MPPFTIITWKDKILDYEIEIAMEVVWNLWQERTWKDKILDYEIEIGLSDSV